MPDGPFLTVSRLAEVLGVKPATVYEWTRQVGSQSVPRYRIGRGYRFILAEVIQWIRETRDVRSSPLPRRARTMPVHEHRRTPDRLSGGHRVKKAVRTRLSANGEAAGALVVPSEGES